MALSMCMPIRLNVLLIGDNCVIQVLRQSHFSRSPETFLVEALFKPLSLHHRRRHSRDQENLSHCKALICHAIYIDDRCLNCCSRIAFVLVFLQKSVKIKSMKIHNLHTIRPSAIAEFHLAPRSNLSAQLLLTSSKLIITSSAKSQML